MKLNKNLSLARLQIAADVVLQIVSGELLPIRGTEIDPKANKESAKLSDRASAQLFLKKFIVAHKTCQVCAKGAIFVAHTLRFNKKTIGDLQNFLGERANKAIPEFTPDMMAQIEYLFEGWWATSAGVSDATMREVDNYRIDNQLSKMSDKDRLLHIMGLIIMNKGKKVVV